MQNRGGQSEGVQEREEIAGKRQNKTHEAETAGK